MYGASIPAPTEQGGHREFYVLLVSEILDHDSQAANMLLNQVLQIIRNERQVNWTAVRTMWLVADCGPHIRSYESAAHYCYTLSYNFENQCECHVSR